MTKQQILAEYSQISMQMGDCVFKLGDLETAAAELKSRMNDLRKTKQSLEERLAKIDTVPAGAPADAVETETK